ncbi:gasdermin-D isoform X3 [Delphinapterus leucas]|nr:gasdermin-D isoform X3 [Delphinapterus leucas]
MDGQLQGSVELAAPGQGKLAGRAAVSGSSSASMIVCTLRVAPNTWEAMRQERRLRQPEHQVLQQLRNRGDDVFVVTEVLQTQQEVEVTRTQKQEGSGQFALPGTMCLQGRGEGHLSQNKMVTIPAGSILAFRVAQLVIGSDWDILFFPDKKQTTFRPQQEGYRPSYVAGGQPQRSSCLASTKFLPICFKFLSDGPVEDRLATTEDFQGLQAEVEAWAVGLEGLSREPCGQLLGALGQVLRDEAALQALDESLEHGLRGGLLEPRDGPVGAVLECLVFSSRRLEKRLAGPVFYLLQALAVLSATQHVLLAEVLEMGALSGSFKLVESLLEQSTPWQERRAVSLPHELLGSSWGSEAPTWVLLEECGLEPQVGAPQVCWKPEAQGCANALYACLALLFRLSRLC